MKSTRDTSGKSKIHFIRFKILNVVGTRPKNDPWPRVHQIIDKNVTKTNNSQK